jgi:hypothetical protein
MFSAIMPWPMTDPDLYGENSWEKLKGKLTKVGCFSGCSVVIRYSCQKKTYQLESNLFIVLFSWVAGRRKQFL